MTQTKAKARDRIAALKQEIEQHRYNVHVRDTSTISEAALDSLKHELFLLEQKFPDLVTSDSPTQRVAGEPLEKFEKVQHARRMLSLFDAFSLEELEDWEKRNKKFIDTSFEYYCELKIDGLAIALTYENGILVRGATRGDGTTGEDVTQNIRTIESIPLRIDLNNKAVASSAATRSSIEIRGEVYLSKEEFERVNKERAKSDEPLYANPRNTAAGTIRQLDPSMAAARKLQFFAYDIVGDLGQKTQEQSHTMLQQLGFATEQNTAKQETIKKAWEYAETFVDRREHFDYQVDGMVIKVNDLQLREQLGVVGKAPRGMIAYKFPAEQATTIVEDIIVQVGRTGALTPVAILQPVLVAGSTVHRATLHNQEEIDRKDVRIGDTVVIQKAGDIIPEVVQVLEKLRPKNTSRYVIPDTCPVCNEPAIKEEDQAVLRCVNPDCMAKHRERLIHAVSRGALNLEGFGPAIIDQLLEAGMVTSIADFYALKKEDLETLDRLGEKSAENLITAVESRKTIPLHRFLFALGIRHVGAQTATEIAQHFTTLKNVQQATAEEIAAIHGIGEKAAEALSAYMQNPENSAMIERILQLGVVIEDAVQNEQGAGKLSGETFVITGTLETISRQELKERIQQHGGKVASAVSASTSYVVAGEKAGSKLKKATERGIPVIDEHEILRKIGR